ncbi:MAG: DNA repair protein RecN, partial [Bacteroidia bacterium]
GKRADTTALRDKSDKCIIEASFNIKELGLEELFRLHDLDYDHHTILRREITNSGKSRSFVNDTPTNLKALTDIGSRLIEIHSQRDNIQLFDTSFQYRCLDVLSGCHKEHENYHEGLLVLKAARKELEDLLDSQAALTKEADYNQFLFDELEAAQLENISEGELIKEQEMLENAEDLIRTFNEADQILAGSDFSVNSQLEALRQVLSSQSTSVTEELVSRVKSVIIELEDVASEIDASVQNIEVNPERLDEVNGRMALLFNLKNKHRVSEVQDLVDLRNELNDKLQVTHNVAGNILVLEQSIASQEKALFKQAAKLSRKRIHSAKEISLKVESFLDQLGMQHSRFRFRLEEDVELNEFGSNKLYLELSSDKGETFVDLKKAASGGELGRINLIIKSLLSSHVRLPSSIYDEIDTGVSGEVARKVGVMMKNMSKSQQTIVITHLPQIASMGDNHLFVYKSDGEETIETKVRELEGEERINEIAKMISGDNLTEHAVEQSKELLKN